MGCSALGLKMGRSAGTPPLPPKWGAGLCLKMGHWARPQNVGSVTENGAQSSMSENGAQWWNPPQNESQCCVRKWGAALDPKMECSALVLKMGRNAGTPPPPKKWGSVLCLKMGRSALGLKMGHCAPPQDGAQCCD